MECRHEGLKHPWPLRPCGIGSRWEDNQNFNYMNRTKANQRLLEILKETLCKNPDLRFIQALWALKIIDSKVEKESGHEIIVPVDRFYEEPSETLKRIGYEENS